MAALVLSLVLSVVIAGALWLMIGSRFEIKEERAYNDLLNVFAYVALLIPPNFLFVFFVLG
ncbi:MAG: hypothetical protein CMP88_01975 [Gammaproteobacteria bacterium]|nr:hypothetical protein [Gammaproteobacteria bacterium]